MNVGEYIRKLRIENGLSQSDLGKIIGVQRAAVQKWECGRVQNLKRETIKKLSELFNVSPSTFITEEDETDSQINLSPHEKELVTAYRNKPDFIKQSVNKLLDLFDEEPTAPPEPSTDNIQGNIANRFEEAANISSPKSESAK